MFFLGLGERAQYMGIKKKKTPADYKATIHKDPKVRLHFTNDQPYKYL